VRGGLRINADPNSAQCWTLISCSTWWPIWKGSEIESGSLHLYSYTNETDTLQQVHRITIESGEISRRYCLFFVCDWQDSLGRSIQIGLRVAAFFTLAIKTSLLDLKASPSFSNSGANFLQCPHLKSTRARGKKHEFFYYWNCESAKRIHEIRTNRHTWKWKKTINLNKKSHIKTRAVKKSHIKTRSMKKSQMKTQSDFLLLLLVQGKAVPRVRWNLIANQSEAENHCNWNWNILSKFKTGKGSKRREREEAYQGA
jgi:hypothetical protein